VSATAGKAVATTAGKAVATATTAPATAGMATAATTTPATAGMATATTAAGRARGASTASATRKATTAATAATTRGRCSACKRDNRADEGRGRDQDYQGVSHMWILSCAPGLDEKSVRASQGDPVNVGLTFVNLAN